MAKTYHLILLLAMLMSFRYSQAQTGYQPDRSMSLKEFENKALEEKDEVWVVDFWASWCGPCIKSMPHTKELYHQYQGQNVRFIGISWDKKPQKWIYALNRLELPWQQIIVPKGEEDFLNKKFPHAGIPTAFVIAKNGKVKKVNDVYDLGKAIEKALKK